MTTYNRDINHASDFSLIQHRSSLQKGMSIWGRVGVSPLLMKKSIDQSIFSFLQCHSARGPCWNLLFIVSLFREPPWWLIRASACFLSDHSICLCLSSPMLLCEPCFSSAALLFLKHRLLWGAWCCNGISIDFLASNFNLLFACLSRYSVLHWRFIWMEWVWVRSIFWSIQSSEYGLTTPFLAKEQIPIFDLNYGLWVRICKLCFELKLMTCDGSSIR